jgi:hypothetical protein
MILALATCRRIYDESGQLLGKREATIASRNASNTENILMLLLDKIVEEVSVMSRNRVL